MLLSDSEKVQPVNRLLSHPWPRLQISTLPVTQVACERSFSVLKYIKNRLMSTNFQEHLEAFMLMAIEKDIVMSLYSELITNRVAETSALLSKLLLPQY